MIVVFRGCRVLSFGYLRWGGLGSFHFSIPFFIMSLSDQHPYALFVAGGPRSPSLAKARVDVGDNTNAYLASVDIVSFLGQAQSTPPNSGSQFDS